MPRFVKFSILPNLLSKDDPRYKKWIDSLKRRPPPWNKGKTKTTDRRIHKISEELRKRKVDNFAVWREKAKRQGLITGSYPLFTKNYELAFLIGLILGDGNIYKFPRSECLCIVLGTDKPLLIEYATYIVSKVLNKKPSVKKRKNSECVNIRIYQNKLSKRLGIPMGARGNLQVKLPLWIWQDKKFLIACLRGLFEAEGSYSVHLKTYTYNLSFSNNNVSLLDEVEKAINSLGYHPERRSNAVRLRRKAETVSFIELISFRTYNST